MNGKPYGNLSAPDTDISFVSSSGTGRSSTDRMFPSMFDTPESGFSNPRLSYSSEPDFESASPYGRRSVDMVSPPPDFSSNSQDSDRLSSSSGMVSTKANSFDVHSHETCHIKGSFFYHHNDADNLVLKFQDDVEAEMRRLKLELKQTMEMYSTACKEALSAKQKVCT